MENLKKVYEVLGETCAEMYQAKEDVTFWRNAYQIAQETARLLVEENKRLKEELKNIKKATYKGKMEIRTVTGHVFLQEGEWEYKAEFDCWYMGGDSFPAEICRKVEEA